MWVCFMVRASDSVLFEFERVAFLNCKGRLLQMIIGTNSLKQLQLSIGNDIM